MPAARRPFPPARRAAFAAVAGVLAACGAATGIAAGCGVAAGEDAGAATSSDPGTSSGDPAPATSAPAPSTSASARPSTPVPTRPAGEIVLVDEEAYPATLEEQRAALFRRMSAALSPGEPAMDRVKAVFAGSKAMGQGNPKVTQHPMTRKACREKRAEAGVVEPEYEMCGAPFMVPVYDPSAGQKPEDAAACVDAYEFPGVPCEHPVVWVSSREAHELCSVLGKRLCDAHEWEGACAGAVRSPETEYAFGRSRRDMRRIQNQDREIVWSYGPAEDHAKCGTRSKKNKGCTSSGFRACGSNTYPAGSFPECKSPFGAYDLHGNAAEHMNFPMKAAELTSAGGTGQTEMKGSWCIFSSYEAHPDDCRWRAPDWHATRLMDRNSHANYHLGFRCCKDVEPEAPSR